MTDRSTISVLSDAAWWRRTLLLIGGVTLARIVYLVFLCPYTLIEDEAHYWEWSRRLEWSYYTKGPGVAWTIAASTRLLGDAHEYAVRLPAALSAGLMTLLVAMIARDVYRSSRTAFFAASCVLLSPMFQSLGLMMTIDSPYAACWALAVWAAWKALGEGKPRAIAITGLALGVGVLYKYTILLAIPGLLLAAWFAPSRRPLRDFLPWLGLALILFVLGISPIIIWNAREGWPTIAHLLGHLGVKGGDMPVTQGGGKGFHYNPLWTLEFIGSQVGLVGPVLLLAASQAIAAWRGKGDADAAPGGERFLIVNSLPIIAFYLLVSFVAEPEGNWPLAGYLSLLPMAGSRAARGLAEWRAKVAAWKSLPEPRPKAGYFRKAPETPAQIAWSASLVVGLATAAAMPRLDLLAKLPGLNKVIPLHRFMGADRMAADVQRHLDALRVRTGQEPFVIATHYGRASQFAFYLKGHPTIYCSSSLMEDGRRTQYDYWADTDLRRQPELLGRPAVAIGGKQPSWEPIFETISPLGTLDGDGKKNRPAYEATGYKGFASRDGGTR